MALEKQLDECFYPIVENGNVVPCSLIRYDHMLEDLQPIGKGPNDTDHYFTEGAYGQINDNPPEKWDGRMLGYG